MYKYQEISNWVEEKIQKKEFVQGDKLPTEKELMDQFNVSRQSVRRAIQQLENKGILHTIQGSGTYISISEKPHSNIIALVLTNYEDYIFPRKISGVYDVLQSAGYIVNLFFTDNHSSKELEIFHTLSSGSYAGMLLDGTQSALPRLDNQLFQKVFQTIPCIMMDSKYTGYHLPCVALDDEQGGYLATKHLIENKHEKIAYIGRCEYKQGVSRYKGYTNALLRYDIPINEKYVFWYTLESYQYLMTPESGALDALIKECTAVFCYNDQVALDLYNILEAKGLRVPEDISIIGYDHALLPGFDKKLSSIDHPKEVLGRTAAKNLLQLIQNPTHDANHLFSPKLIIGETVKKLSLQ